MTLNSGDVVTLFAIGEGVNQPQGVFATLGNGSSTAIALEQPFTTLTPGLNGSWYHPETDGQGMLVEVLPELGSIFVAWFSFDTTFPDAEQTTLVGDSKQRWCRELNGTSADLTLYLTAGIFDQDNAVTIDPAGTFSIDFDYCRRVNLSYSTDGSGLTGNTPLPVFQDQH